ncbi:MAG: hypothetical protein IT223_03565 [Crocinitomicaceae bacterium]|nr:hypothetical protein [Crocinitomicaceae bacterium]
MNRDSIIHPRTALFTLLAIGALCFLLMATIPKEGVSVGHYRVHFKTLGSFFEKDSVKKLEDIEAYFAALDSLKADSVVTSSDSLLSVKRVQGITSLQFKDSNSSPLFSFFEDLHKAKDEGIDIHVLHYGDSQIEGDRMTRYLRDKWQEDFGGYGPGLVSPVPITSSAAIIQNQSSNWKRYTAYGFDNGKASHNHYGIMAAFGRFTPAANATEIVPSDTAEAWIELKPSSLAAPRCRQFSEAILYFGYHQQPLKIELWVNDSLVSEKRYVSSSSLIAEHWPLGRTPQSLRFVFRGADSPDVQGIVLQSPGGVHVDNLALRGSNGNIFKRIDPLDIDRVMSDLNASLIILQFGGNSLPYIEDKKGAVDYGKFFRAQIQHIKMMVPDATFIVVGPSDMSTAIDGEYQTWPFLEDVRDAMKEAAFAEDCAFWDMYAVMGGKNSMLSWVSNDPPYAGPDYTHFTPVGARKMAELFYRAIKTEYDNWYKAKYSGEKGNVFIKVPGGA